MTNTATTLEAPVTRTFAPVPADPGVSWSTKRLKLGLAAIYHRHPDGPDIRTQVRLAATSRDYQAPGQRERLIREGADRCRRRSARPSRHPAGGGRGA